MDYATARQNMLDGQIRTFNVVDPAVLDAFSRIPREMFVPASERGRAYLDAAVPIGSRRVMMQPMVLARLLQAAEPAPGDSALVVGAGSGYSAAILARLVAKVVAAEEEPALLAEARTALSGSVGDKVQLVQAPPGVGERKYAPYNIILVDGGLARPPQGLADQLAEGGRMVGILVQPGIGRATLWRKNKGGMVARTLFDASADFLPGLEPATGFVF